MLTFTDLEDPIVLGLLLLPFLLLGLFAVIAAFFLKFAKVIGVAAIALSAGVWKFFRRKPTDA